MTKILPQLVYRNWDTREFFNIYKPKALCDLFDILVVAELDFSRISVPYYPDPQELLNIALVIDLVL